MLNQRINRSGTKSYDLVLNGTIINYDHLITTQPHRIRRVFISDLHLSADEPALVQAFLALLDDLIALPHLLELYILGDWFDAWIGDDAYLSLTASKKVGHWITPLVSKLAKLHDNGCQVFVMHGNRDFLLGQAFCDTFKGQLIHEPYNVRIGKEMFRLEHGDALCKDDVSYQRFRKIMRNPIVQWLLLKRPLNKRQILAQKIRSRSSEGKLTKSLDIMDVNEDAVLSAMTKVDHLLHGHTHRPNIHQTLVHNELKKRYVLGDWRVIKPNSKPNSAYTKVEAVIAMTVLEEPLNDQNTQQANTLGTPRATENTSTSINHNVESFNLINFQH